MKLRQAIKLGKSGRLMPHRTALAACKTLNRHNVQAKYGSWNVNRDPK